MNHKENPEKVIFEDHGASSLTQISSLHLLKLTKNGRKNKQFQGCHRRLLIASKAASAHEIPIISGAKTSQAD